MSVDRSAVTGDLAQRNVRSALVINRTSDTIHGFVEYQTMSGTENEVFEFDLEGNGKEEKCEEKVHAMATVHASDSSHSKVYPKVITSLQVQTSDGEKLKIMAPFENVPHGEARNWKFVVDKDKIRSEAGNK